jgi:hypothetical protein
MFNGTPSQFKLPPLADHDYGDLVQVLVLGPEERELWFHHRCEDHDMVRMLRVNLKTGAVSQTATVDCWGEVDE